MDGVMMLGRDGALPWSAFSACIDDLGRELENQSRVFQLTELRAIPKWAESNATDFDMKRTVESTGKVVNELIQLVYAKSEIQERDTPVVFSFHMRKQLEILQNKNNKQDPTYSKLLFYLEFLLKLMDLVQFDSTVPTPSEKRLSSNDFFLLKCFLYQAINCATELLRNDIKLVVSTTGESRVLEQKTDKISKRGKSVRKEKFVEYMKRHSKLAEKMRKSTKFDELEKLAQSGNQSPRLETDLSSSSSLPASQSGMEHDAIGKEYIRERDLKICSHSGEWKVDNESIEEEGDWASSSSMQSFFMLSDFGWSCCGNITYESFCTNR